MNDQVTKRVTDHSELLPPRELRPAGRVLAIAGGILLLAVAGFFALGLAIEVREGLTDTWYRTASFGLLGLVLGVAGVQLLYLGVSGRRRGPVHRWLTAFLDGWARYGW